MELEKFKTMEYTIGNDGKKIASTSPSLLRAIVRTFWWPYLSIGLFIGTNVIVMRTLNPIFQRMIIRYFSDPGSRDVLSKNEALGYASALVLTIFTVIVVNHYTGARSMEVAMRLRVACSTLIYRKILRLSKSSLNRTTPGQIINLLSNDVSRFDTMSGLINFIWIMPLQILVVGSVMWQSIGSVAIVGLGSILILIVPLQLIVNKFARYLRARIATKTDWRIQLMSELLAGIQVVKMYAWEKPFEKIILRARAAEIGVVRQAAYLRGLYLGCMMVTDKIALYSSIMTYISLGNGLSAELTFPLVTYFNILQAGAAYFFPLALIQAGEAAVSVGRLQEFLLLDEISRDDLGDEEKLGEIVEKENNMSYEPMNNNSSVEEKRSVTIEVEKACANWIHGQLPPTLCQATFRVNAGELCALVGPVASGKSSILNLLLRELPLGSGMVKFRKFEDKLDSKKRGFVVDDPTLTVSYASQEPWLFSGTVRENILFGQTYDPDRYERVTKACALKRDLRHWPNGDRTVVGENGIALSGGQRARVNLARAIYKDADVYLLDDPLSAVDARVARHIYERCIDSFLHGKTRIVTTHQIQFLRTADTIVVLDHGTIKAQGIFRDLEENCLEFRTLVHQTESEKDPGENEKILENLTILTTETKLQDAKSDEEKGKKSQNDSSDDSEYEVEFVPQLGSKDDEVSNKGGLSSKVYLEYVKSCGSWLIIFFTLFLIVVGQIANTAADYWISYWINLEAVRKGIETGEIGANNSEYVEMSNNSFFEKFSMLDDEGLLPNYTAVNIYTTIIFCSVFFNVARSFAFMHVSTMASQALHNKMFSSVLHATMRFFNANPSGRVLNRFSKDLGVVDELLPRILLEAVRLALAMIGVFGMIIYLNNIMIIPVFFLGTIFYFARRYYLKTSYALKRLEGVCKSPVFSHVKATINGLTTVRTSGQKIVRKMKREFDELQDIHSGAWYLGIMASTTFGFYADLMACFFIGSVCFSFILLDNGDLFGGSVGLAISQALLITGVLQYGVKQSAEAMNHMTAVERILQYVNLPNEGSLTSDDPPPDSWPREGKISLENVSLKYGNSENTVLKNLNVKIEPGWKVGVVGRTGAGKSSLIAAIFRLENEGLSGKIAIDDRETSSLGLHELRSKISIIPQEPVFFSGNLRYNLDPFGCYDDADLWRALKEVELDDLTLEQIVQERGNNYSVGQRQLICLARAILKNNRILMLDEATANIDSQTDYLIQKTLRTRFADHTVITVAHRLNTVIDNDRILIMDLGEIIEFGCPNVLLRTNPDGPFSRMVAQAGSEAARSLMKAAETACNQNPKHKCH